VKASGVLAGQPKGPRPRVFHRMRGALAAVAFGSPINRETTTSRRISIARQTRPSRGSCIIRVYTIPISTPSTAHLQRGRSRLHLARDAHPNSLALPTVAKAE